jgi:hypothetical protein
MFTATEVIKNPALLRPIIAASVGRELSVNRDVFEAREAAIEILGQLTTLAAGIPGASEPSTVALKLRNDAERAIIEQFAQRNLRFDPTTTKVTRLSQH